MNKRPLRPCTKQGCSELVERGYCPAHIPDNKQVWTQTRKELDRRKTPESISFYNDRKWTQISKAFRKQNPLCKRCKADGIITPAQLVHHEPSVQELVSRGLNPYDSRHLESLCHKCHNRELQAKRWAGKRTEEVKIMFAAI